MGWWAPLSTPNEQQGTTRAAAEPSPAPKRAWVAVVVGDARREVVELVEDAEISVGRSASSGIPIADSQVSRLHASLRWEGGSTVTVTDHDSRNGVFVGGRRISRRATVANGDEVRIGPARLLVVVPAPEPSPETHPVAVDPTMLAVLGLVERASQCELPVLLVGETGVGKEVLARRVHSRSARAHGPFVAINCGSIPEGLAESVLFGHEKGAFTDANARAPGIFERADGGTLLLDEVGELSPATQARLLRVIEEGQVTRVGATKPTPIDVRILTATNRDLAGCVQSGRFREDLLYRIDVLRIEIPPLRDRPDDVLFLAHGFLAEHGASLAFDATAEARLAAYAWPGNVRELQNAVARAVALSPSAVIGAKDLGLGAGDDEVTRVALDEQVANAERAALVRALDATSGNQTRAARRLGVTRRALIYKMEKHGLKAPPPSKKPR